MAWGWSPPEVDEDSGPIPEEGYDEEEEEGAAAAAELTEVVESVDRSPIQIPLYIPPPPPAPLVAPYPANDPQVP